MEEPGKRVILQAPRLSIITVCFNAKEAIETTLTSVASLEFQDFEYLVIDGGSQDGTLEIVKQYAHVVSRVFSEPDNGIYDAMNKGMRLAKGEFIWFLNAGDTVHDPEFLKLADWTADFLYGGVVLINGTREHMRIMPKGRIGRYSSLRGQVCCHQSMLVRRSLAPPYDLSIRIVSDFDWSIRILSLKGLRTSRIPRYLVNYDLEGLSSRHFHICWKERISILSANYGKWARLLGYTQYMWATFKRVAKPYLRPCL